MWHDILLKDAKEFPHFIQDKSAATFCCQVAAWVRDMLRNFYLVKSHNIAIDSTTTEAREKNKHRFGIFRIFDNVWLNLKTIKFC